MTQKNQRYEPTGKAPVVIPRPEAGNVPKKIGQRIIKPDQILKICLYTILVALSAFCVVLTYELYLLSSHDLIEIKSVHNPIEVNTIQKQSSKIAGKSASEVNSTEEEFNQIPEEYLKTEVAQLISIRQAQDISFLRGKLITLLWGKPELPSLLPSAIIKGFTDSRYQDISSLSLIDKLTIKMEFGLESYIYHFIPKTTNNKVVLYHEGHQGDFYIRKEQIKRFLDNGYSVVAFSMPLLGFNNQPTVPLPRNGNLKLTSHDQIKFLSPKNGHPIKYFIEPVIAMLNYLENNFDYGEVSMTGISGGGWTTTLAAAVDDRIEKSFPVAGSYPIFLRSNSPRDWGDYEQTAPELYQEVNYLELYILGSYGNKRKQLQIINKYDACCFAGIKWKTYKDLVNERVHTLEVGEFDLFLDDTHNQHIISNVAMNRILDELAN